MRISDWSSDVCSSDLWVWPTRTGRKTVLEAGCSLITSVPISEQSKRVEHDEQRRTFMDHTRRADAEPHDCRGHEQGSDAEADAQLTAEDPRRPAAQAHRERHVRKIIGQKRHTGSHKNVVRSGRPP